MASSSPKSKHPKSGVRRSLPVPTTTRSSSSQRASYGSSSTTTSRDPDLSCPLRTLDIAQRFIPVSSLKTIAKVASEPSHSAASSISSIARLGSGITRPSNQTQIRQVHECTTSSTFKPSTIALDFQTPVNAVGRFSSHEKGEPTTPKGPRQHYHGKLPFSAPVQTPSKKAPSPYQNIHIADPCIPGALVHQLSPCGHKVITSKPDPCASNCRRPLSQQALSTFVNLLQSTEPFVCAACVELHVQSHRVEKQTLFIERMNATELQMGSFPPGWREEQSEYWDRVWENDVQAERAQFEKLGRKCGYISGEPIQEGEVREVGGVSSMPSPWPPLKRPVARRDAGKIDAIEPEGQSESEG